MENLLTVKDVAEYLQMSKEKIYKLAQQGGIPATKIVDQWRFRLDRLNSWLEENELEKNTQILNIRKEVTVKAEPILKWAGGKGQLIRQYEDLFPETFDNYFEPFVGAGAVFFHLVNTGRLRSGGQAILIDSNEELINCYSVIKDNVERVILILSQSKYANEEGVFYQIRSEIPIDRFERAARTIYLNKTCFNGLYRVNSKGKFNVPFGRYKNPSVCNGEKLRAVKNALSHNVTVLCSDFGKCLELADSSSFVYFDPPYQPLNKTSNFTSYTKDSFGEKDQERLCSVFNALDKKGCKVMLSNSDTDFIRRLYRGYEIKEVQAKRTINCKASGRGVITELVITNY